MSHQTLLFYFTCLFPVLLVSQNKQGNIVEYFGKEKVESIQEGEVLHTFTDGLLLRGNRFSQTNSSAPNHSIFAHRMLNPEYKISEGKIESLDSKKWTKISVNEKNEFSNNGLRSGHLFLSYSSDKEYTVLFEASGHTQLLINGLPYEGDHYDFGYTLIPIKLKKGLNDFILSGGRFPRIRARILLPNKKVFVTTRDMTLPDILQEESNDLWGGLRVINLHETDLVGYKIISKIGTSTLETTVPTISPMTVRKIGFNIPNPNQLSEKKIEAQVSLQNYKGKTQSIDTISLNVKSIYKHHKKTFISNIDGSVQYYSIAPALDSSLEKPALFLSVHGASVEAVNQANAYKQKDWGHLVAPTNRRPFGFAWEDWGRLDALEVLDYVQKLYKTDTERTYLTGHSMGGHGTWYLGATYPDKWAAIAPCAGYPERESYVSGFRKRLMSMSEDELKNFGMTKAQVDQLLNQNNDQTSVDILIDSISGRAGNPVRTLKLKKNYLHHGVYILHGEKDNVVPTYLARDMRKRLGEYHNDFTYYEYPGGKHWYGNHSVDWPPIFDFFKARSLKKPETIQNLEFFTASPGVSSKSNFVSIVQQKTPFEVSSFKFSREDGLELSTDNIQTMTIDLQKIGEADQIKIDGQHFNFDDKSNLQLSLKEGSWVETKLPSLEEKGPHRNGGFKDAFKNNMIFVYATNGNSEENEWYYNKARYDAQTFWYRANGNIEIIKDVDFQPSKYPDRNVILYGNKANNSAWDILLKKCPLQVTNNQVKMGYRILTGGDWGAYFTYPRPDSDFASVGVITASGIKGMKAAFGNHYFQNSTNFPDVTIFNTKMLTDGIKGVFCSGFFGNNWTVETGDFVWR